jgi:tetratricopeptide (TPR) repeat protein
MPKPAKSKPQVTPISAAGVRALMAETLGGLDLHRRSNADRAQDLVYEAMEARTPARRLRLATQALDLDPENVDALLMLTDAVPLGDAARITVLRDIVAVGAKRLGPKTFKKLAPHFWGHLETRPYMRAREYLAEDLRAAGRLEEAVQEYTGMLALNENDNQGMRYHLLPCLLALRRLGEAQALMKRYVDDCDWSVVFSWGRVLAFLLAGEPAAAAKALVIARKQNPHIEIFLRGRRKVPKRLPDLYSHGSEEEALCFAEPLLMAWARYPDCQKWLAGQPSPIPLQGKK